MLQKSVVRSPLSGDKLTEYLMQSLEVPPPRRTKWTRRVPHPVLIGHAASLTPY